MTLRDFFVIEESRVKKIRTELLHKIDGKFELETRIELNKISKLSFLGGIE